MDLVLGLHVQAPTFLAKPRGGPVGFETPCRSKPGSRAWVWWEAVWQLWEMTRHSLHRQSIHSQEMLGQLLQEVCMQYPARLALLPCPLGGLGRNSLTLLLVALL